MRENWEKIENKEKRDVYYELRVQELTLTRRHQTKIYFHCCMARIVMKNTLKSILTYT
jgi:hypothetical protein